MDGLDRDMDRAQDNRYLTDTQCLSVPAAPPKAPQSMEPEVEGPKTEKAATAVTKGIEWGYCGRERALLG